MTSDHLPEAVDTERAPPPPPQAFGILSEKEFVRPSWWADGWPAISSNYVTFYYKYLVVGRRMIAAVITMLYSFGGVYFHYY